MQGNRIGGIAGRILKPDAKIQNCYNRGDITGTEGGNAGGIVGICEVTTSMTLKNCYNTGKITGTAACRGAVMGYSYLTKLTDVQKNYSIECDGCGIIGGIAGTTVFADENACFIDKAGLGALADTKASTAGLGEAYRKDLKPINDGYPILAWQMPADEYARLVGAQQQQQTPQQTPTQTPAPSSPSAPKKGTLLKSKKVTYKVTKAGKKNGTVEYSKISGNPKKVSIPASVTINGITYKVTSIAKNACKGNKKLTTVKIAKNVTTIGADAFYACRALKTVTIGTQTTTIGSRAFAKCTKLARITIPAKIKSIGKKAFYGCGDLKNITIKTTKLTKKKVGTRAFGAINKNAVIKVPKKKLKIYKTLLRAKGIGAKVKIRS